MIERMREFMDEIFCFLVDVGEMLAVGLAAFLVIMFFYVR